MTSIAQRWILLPAVAACGQVLPEEPGPSPDAAPSLVKVTVLTYAGDGVPDPSAWMIFYDPEGNVVHEGPVNAMGQAEVSLPTGGSVTEVRIVADTSTTLDAQLTTITDVKPGDDLTFGFKAHPTIANQGGQTSMTASFTPVPGATNHHFYTTCGVTTAGTTSPVTLSFRDSCHDATFDLLVVASGGSLSTPQFISLSDVAYQTGQTFTIPGGYTPMGSFRVNAANVPMEISNLVVSRSSMLEHVAVAAQTSAVGDPGGGQVSVDVPFPLGVGARSEVSLTLSRPDASGTQQHSLHTSMLTSSIDVDLGRQQVPWLKHLAVTATGLTWATAVEGDTPDGMVTVWSGRWTSAGRTTSIGWRIVHPSRPSGISLQRLPQRHARLDPQAQIVSITPGSGGVSIVDYDVVAGYAEFRQQPDTLVMPAIDLMGAFVGMPYQRRMYTAHIFAP